LGTAPGFGWINAFSVAWEIGDIERFASPAKLCFYTGLCPHVIQSGSSDNRRRRVSKHVPRYLCAGQIRARVMRLWISARGEPRRLAPDRGRRPGGHDPVLSACELLDAQDARDPEMADRAPTV
jgi:transposase